MTVLDCWLGAAYRLYAIDGAQAQAVSGVRAILGGDANLCTAAQTKLAAITKDVQDRDFISKVHASILSAALAQ